MADGCVGEVGVQEAPRPGLDEPFGSLVRWTGWRSRSRPWGCGQVGERLLGQTCERSGRQARNTFCARCAGRRLSPWPADSASRRLPRRAPEVDGPIRGCRRGQVLGPSGSRARCAGRRPMFNVGGPIRRGLPGGCVRRPAARPLARRRGHDTVSRASRVRGKDAVTPSRSPAMPSGAGAVAAASAEVGGRRLAWRGRSEGACSCDGPDAAAEISWLGPAVVAGRSGLPHARPPAGGQVSKLTGVAA